MCSRLHENILVEVLRGPDSSLCCVFFQVLILGVLFVIWPEALGHEGSALDVASRVPEAAFLNKYISEALRPVPPIRMSLQMLGLKLFVESLLKHGPSYVGPIYEECVCVWSFLICGPHIRASPREWTPKGIDRELTRN